MKKIISSIAFLWMLPLFAFAQFITFGAGSNPFLTILLRVKDLLDTAVPIVITLALIYFIYGVGSYVVAKDDEKKTEARNVMIYGTIGLFFIVSVWGIVTLLQQFTGVQPFQTPPSIPRVPDAGSSGGLDFLFDPRFINSGLFGF
ncbi:MAG: hypothetical protein Q8R36_05125 [bacterium]|nr:hypothetical protein [bacterium]